MADEIRNLAADIAKAPGNVRPLAKKALEVTARNIKDQWSKDAKRTGLEKYGATVDYDVDSGVTTLTAEIGPNLGKKNASFGFVEDAPGDVRSAPQHAGRDALEANEQDFFEGLAKAAADALLEALE